jgi:hypothetical protein
MYRPLAGLFSCDLRHQGKAVFMKAPLLTGAPFSAAMIAGPLHALPAMPASAHTGVHGDAHSAAAMSVVEAARKAPPARSVTRKPAITGVQVLGLKLPYLTDPQGSAVEIVQRLSH